jgi:transcriptional regulator with XRE-family HTH domain
VAAGAPDEASYGALLRELRTAGRLSGYALARALGLHPNQLARTEDGVRPPAGPAEVLAVGRALRLERPDLDRLLSAAGHWPSALLELGPDDPTLRALGDVLTDPALPTTTRRRLRTAVEALADGLREFAREHAGLRRDAAGAADLAATAPLPRETPM